MWKLNPGTRLLLWLRHQHYAGKDKEISQDYHYIAEYGLPRPDVYMVIRSLYFDSLRYVYRPGAKVFSWENRHNYVLMSPPTLLQLYTGKLDYGSFVVVTDNDRYAILLRQKFKGCSYRRAHQAYVLGAPRFANLKEYLDFLSLITYFEKDYFLGKHPLDESLAALRSLYDRAEQAGAAASQLEAERGAPPQDRLAIDVDTLNHTIRRQDTWI